MNSTFENLQERDWKTYSTNELKAQGRLQFRNCDILQHSDL
jgi:hypothetical protein